MKSMKTLPKMQISDELSSQISQGIELSGLRKAAVVQQALRIGLPHFITRFQTPPLWLEGRLRDALAECAKPVSPAQFARKMKGLARRR
jgi:hypothetical protein